MGLTVHVTDLHRKDYYRKETHAAFLCIYISLHIIWH